MCKILIVDDDPDSRNLLEAIIQNCSNKHEVVAISVRNLAIRMIRSHPFDVIITVMRIPVGHNGEIDAHGGLAVVKAAVDGLGRALVLLISGTLHPMDAGAISFGANAERVRIVSQPEAAIEELVQRRILSLS